MTSKKLSSDILTDASFRRTRNCSHYQKFIGEKKIQKYPIKSVASSLLTSSSVFRNGLEEPLLIPFSDPVFGLKVPPSQTKLSEVAEIVGVSTDINIMEVGSQNEILGWTIGDFARYLENRSKDHKIINLISLEISASPFSARVQSPHVVRGIDWIDIFW